MTFHGDISDYDYTDTLPEQPTMSAFAERDTSFGQTDLWKNQAGQVIRIDDMSVSYKANVVRFLERRAPNIVKRAVSHKVADAVIAATARLFKPVPCVMCEGLNGDGTMQIHRFAHGVDHSLYDTEKYPDENDAMVEDLWGKARAATPSYTDAEAVAMIRATPLMQRLIDDVAHNRGGAIT